jgi:hypothetical protein
MEAGCTESTVITMIMTTKHLNKYDSLVGSSHLALTTGS